MGSKFFRELKSGKAATKTKVYDSLISEELGHQPDEASEKPLYMSYHEDDFELEPEYVESLVAQDGRNLGAKLRG